MKVLTKDNLITSKDNIINAWSEKTGLDVNMTSKLYDRFSANSDGKLVSINESFDNFISKKITNFSEFEANIKNLAGRVGDVELNDDERYEVTAELVEIINNIIGGDDVDLVTVIQVVCFLLSGNDDFYVNDLNENVHIENNDVYFLPIMGNIPLYESVVEIMIKNNTITGYPNQIKDMYTSIVGYLQNEIKETVNKDNIHSIDTINHINILNEFFVAQTINPMYLSNDVLKTLVPDVQAFVFDLAFLIDTYFTNNKYYIEFVSEKAYLGYVNASDSLYGALASSLKGSKIMGDAVDMTGGTMFSNYSIQNDVLRIPNNSISINQVANMIHIIKAATNEFNLNIRKVINTYVTKSLELLVSTEKVIIKSKTKR